MAYFYRNVSLEDEDYGFDISVSDMYENMDDDDRRRMVEYLDEDDFIEHPEPDPVESIEEAVDVLAEAPPEHLQGLADEDIDIIRQALSIEEPEQPPQPESPPQADATSSLLLEEIKSMVNAFHELPPLSTFNELKLLINNL